MDRKEELREQDLSYVWHPETLRKELVKWGAKIIAEGKGYKLKDIDGKEYIDALGGMECTNIGHGRQEIIDVMTKQGKKLEFEHIFYYFTHEPVINLSKKLAEVTPGDLQYTFFGNSGSDAIEVSLKMAKNYQAIKGFPNRYKVFSRWNSFHGATMGALSVNGMTGIRGSFGPLVPGSRHLPPPDCYHCYYGKKHPNCNIDCAEALEKEILLEGPKTVAAFIGEPIASSSGVIPPPKEYWPKIREICDKYGVLLIADEVLIGFGKSGKLFACENYDLVPDMVVMGKGITSGYFPLSAVIVKPEIYETFQDKNEPFLHPQTYQGHPIGCAVALKNIEIIERENLVKNAEVTGKYFGEQLKTLANNHPQVIANTNGKGLPHHVLFHPEIGSTTTDTEMMIKIRERAYELGIISRIEPPNYIMFCPPLVFDKEAVNKTMEVMDQVCSEIEKGYL
jgi:putrescine aminotransferase